MDMREQMDAAWSSYASEFGSDYERHTFEAGFQAALDLFANPSDEMVERCVDAVAQEAILRGSMHDMARACLAAAVGGE